MKVVECDSLEDVRRHIDRVDARIVALLARRGGYVRQAARFKKSAREVAAPQRVEQVIARVAVLARALRADPVVTEQVYRAMPAGFIAAERAALTPGKLT